MAARGGGSRPGLSQTEHGLWRDLIEQRCGLDFGTTRGSTLGRCLRQRMAALGLGSFSAYFHRLAQHGEDSDEWRNLLELLTNGETDFFRHQASYKALRKEILPRILADPLRRYRPQITLWSAGCSSGEEPYSMAMAVLEELRALGETHTNLAVWGTDISRSALERARRGHYRSDALRTVPDDCRHYFELVHEASRDGLRVRRQVKEKVRFGSFNLTRPGSGWVTGQDVIFCQNVLIYFRSSARAEAVRQLCHALAPGGFLVLGPGEMVGLKEPGIRSLRVEDALIYQRSA